MADPLTLHPFSLALRSRPKSEDACKSEVLFNEHVGEELINLCLGLRGIRPGGSAVQFSRSYL